jgi:polysaccharide biosynthesis/export protein
MKMRSLMSAQLRHRQKQFRSSNGDSLKVNRLISFSRCVILLAGCLGVALAQPPAPPQANPPAADESKASIPTVPKASEGSFAPVDTKNYVLGPEDVIFIKTWREPDFTFTTAIRPDGKITLPLYGDLQAAGLTPEQLGLNIKEALTKYINAPDVQVFVVEVRSKKYFIDGEVKRTGPYPLVTKTTVLEALSNCGGFLDFANRKDIHILRGSKVLHFNWADVTKGKKLQQNIELENGDHIIVR